MTPFSFRVCAVLLLFEGEVATSRVLTWMCSPHKTPAPKKKRVLESLSRKESTARVTSTVRVTGKERAKERKAKTKDQARRRNLHPTRASGFTFSFDDSKCYMHRGNKRVEILRKGRIFVLRMRRNWLKGGMVTPTRCGKDEMGVTEDSTCVDPGTAAAEAAVAVRTRVDEPGDDPQPPRPREVRPCSTRPGAEAVRQHNLTHCPYQSWCEVCVASKGSSDHYHKDAPESKDGDVARVQMDFMFVTAEGSFVDKATVLMVVCKDDKNLAAKVGRTKTDE